MEDVFRITTVFLAASLCAEQHGITPSWYIYRWEIDTAAVLPCKRIPVSSLNPMEISMYDEIEALWSQGQLERTAAYRECQSVFSAINRYGYELDNFKTPENVCLRDIAEGEIRVMLPDDNDPNQQVAYYYHEESGTTTRLLPTNLTN